MKLIFLLTALFFLPGCSLLGVYVVEDSLTAAEHNDLGVVYEGQNKLKPAIKEYQKAIKKDDVWHIPYFNLGNVHYKLSEPHKAIKYYRMALKRSPENPDIMNNLACALLKTGDDLGAEKWIEKAIAIDAKPEFLDTRDKIRARTPGD
jgi:tetratricopeptide (TPR) repeat protein